MRHWDKKLLSRLGTTSKFCECGRLFTFKVRTGSHANEYFYYDKCVFCRGQSGHRAKKEQKLFYDLKIKNSNASIANESNQVSLPRENAEIKENQRVREEPKSPLDTLFIF